jgi:hypothetical protein
MSGRTCYSSIVLAALLTLVGPIAANAAEIRVVVTTFCQVRKPYSAYHPVTLRSLSSSILACRRAY